MKIIVLNLLFRRFVTLFDFKFSEKFMYKNVRLLTAWVDVRGGIK